MPDGGLFDVGGHAVGLVKSGAAILLVAVGAAAYVFPQQGQSTESISTDVVAAGEYELYRAGRSTGCVLRKGAPAGAEQVELELSGCLESLGDYAGVRYWRDQADGSVELVAANGSVLLQFATGDGAAYEAFGAGVPLFSLSDGTY